jgi:hypothetical protein
MVFLFGGVAGPIFLAIYFLDLAEGNEQDDLT